MIASTIEELALQVASLTYTVSKFLKEQGHEQPSFAASGPFAFPASAPGDVKTAREKLLEATQTLHDVILGPEETLRRKATEWADPAALRWIQHFKIANHVPLEGSISYPALAAAASVPLSQLKRIVRFTMLNGFFVEPSPNQVSHSALSHLLATSPPLQDYVNHAIEFSYPVSVKMVEMTENWKGSDDKSETAFNVAYDTKLPMFAWLQGEPEHAARFGRLMGAMKSESSYGVEHLVRGYDWKGLGKGKVVDVGGSGGHASVAVAKEFGDLEFVVQDLDYVVKQSQDSLPDGFKERVTFQAHDFFTEQPVTDGDVYLLRQILHDWPDESAIVILKHLVKSLKAGAKILVMDQVVPAPGALPVVKEKAARTVDLVVMSHFNGKQRDLDDWKEIFKAVDERLSIANVTLQAGSVLSVIELGLDAAPEPNGTAEGSEEVVQTNGHMHVAEEKVEANGASASDTKESAPAVAEAAAADETALNGDKLEETVDVTGSEKSWTEVPAPSEAVVDLKTPVVAQVEKLDEAVISPEPTLA